MYKLQKSTETFKLSPKPCPVVSPLGVSVSPQPAKQSRSRQTKALISLIMNQYVAENMCVFRAMVAGIRSGVERYEQRWR